MERNKQHIFDKPENVRRLLWLLYFACALLLAIELFFHRHVEHAWESMWGFYSFYGFMACISLVLLAKQLRKLVKRPEDYYDQ
jgi:membrane protein YdbS with pleckstrin-like domain